MADFDGKVVLVTGAAGGIGQALCRHFGSLGAAVAALDRRPEVERFAHELSAGGIAAAGAVADIAVMAEVESAVDALRATLGDPDVLINNAGVSARSSLETSTPESWRGDVDDNLNGAYHCTSAVLPAMKEKGGAIVNIGSVNGLTSLGDPAYSAAKAGLISFTRALAMEYGRCGIRANVICPGTVRTPLWQSRAERNPEILAELVKWYPLQRIAEPEDVARAAAFLASGDAAAITGAILPVDCGLTAGNIVMSRELTLETF